MSCYRLAVISALLLAAVTAHAQTIASVTLKSANVAGGAVDNVTVSLVSVAPPNGVTVTLTSSNPAVILPTTIRIAANSLQTSFNAKTAAVAKDATATITATFGTSSKSANVTVTAPTLKGFTLPTSTIDGGRPLQGTITISSIAPAGGMNVAMASNNSNVIVPNPVVVPEGAKTTTFIATTKAVFTSTVAKVTATIAKTSLSANLTVTPPKFQSLTLSPSTLGAGEPCTGTISLSSIAPAGGLKVTLKSSNAHAVIAGPAMVPEGKTSTTFLIRTNYLTAKVAATISATVLTTTHSAVLTINPGRALSAGPWPKAYGNNQNTSISDVALAKGVLKWELDFLSGGFGTPALGVGEIGVTERYNPFVMARLDIFGSDSSVLHKVNLNSWQASDPASGPDGVFYVTTVLGLTAIGTDGSVKFSLNLQDSKLGKPVVGANGTVYVAGTHLFAINPNGTKKWAITGNYEIIGTDSASNVYTALPTSVSAFSTAGKALWKAVASLTTPLIGSIGSDGSSYLATVSSGKVSLTALTPAGKPKWVFASGASACPPAIAPDGTVYNVSGSPAAPVLQAITAAGSLKWAQPVPADTLDTNVAFWLGSRSDNAALLTYGPNLLDYAADGTQSWYKTYPGMVIQPSATGPDGSVYTTSSFTFNTPIYPVNVQYQPSRLTHILPAGKVDWTFYGGGPQIAAAAVAVDGTIYAPTLAGVLRTVSKDGIPGWFFVADGPIVNTPTLAGDGTVYFGTYPGTIYALTAKGVLKWTYKIDSLFAGSIAMAYDGTLYVQSGLTSLYALNPNGTAKWILPGNHDRFKGFDEASPAVGLDGTIYYSDWAAGFHALDQFGQILWSGKGFFNATPTVTSEGNIILGDFGNTAFNLSGQPLWSDGSTVDGYYPVLESLTLPGYLTVGVNLAYGFHGNAVVWQDGGSNENALGCITASGIVYVPGSIDRPGKVFDDGQLYAVDSKSGALIWKYPQTPGTGRATSLAFDGTVYLVSDDGVLRAIG